ncbi:hypothetical protein Patl1_32421 [Pistacia atlantica]|uniref:Uncharacterized protein n=1 Tax=Pistacia atlantica TaxID=434234 RepID=A0ACC1APT6_9ROSI|nr:hypothetical protein Patl1_32421 [Pistacia atlantica]
MIFSENGGDCNQNQPYIYIFSFRRNRTDATWPDEMMKKGG